MPAANVQVHRANPDTSRLARRIERKFYLPPEKILPAYGLLRQVCRPDSKYPSEQINSLYFDTADLEQYRRSLSGEFWKDKVRIRWYGNNDNDKSTTPVFLELKSREGFASTKQRLELQMPTEKLALHRLRDGIVPRTLLSDTLAKFGHFPTGPLQPIIEISYWRYRFTELLTGMRVALDCHIRSTMMARDTGYGERELGLPGGVIEIKGMSLEIPVSLRRIRILDIDWSRFSKYSTCMDSHNEELGTVGRLSPSGKIIQL
jgi:hypothetical protein